MELDLGLIADNAHADALNKLYIMGEFRYIAATSVPATHPRMVLVFRLVAEAAEVRGREVPVEIELVDADGNPVMPRTPPIPMRFAPSGPARRGREQAQVVANIDNLTLPRFGDYSFSIRVDGRHIGSVPFHLAQVDQSQRPATPAGPGN